MEQEKVENIDVILLVDSISKNTDIAELPLHPRHFNEYLKKIHIIFSLNVMGYHVDVLPSDIDNTEYPKYYIGEAYKEHKDYILPKYNFPRFSNRAGFSNYLNSVNKVLENFDIINNNIKDDRMEIFTSCIGIIDQYANGMALDISNTPDNKDLPPTITGLLNCFSIFGLLFNLRNLSVQYRQSGLEINPDIEDMLSYIISQGFRELGKEYPTMFDSEKKLTTNLDNILVKVKDIFIKSFGLEHYVEKDMMLTPSMLGALWMFMTFTKPSVIDVSLLGNELGILETPLNLDIYGRILQYTNALNEHVELEFERNKFNKGLIASITETIVDYINLNKINFNPTMGILVRHIDNDKCYVIFHREEETKLFINALVDLDKVALREVLEDKNSNYTFKVFTLFNLNIIELDYVIYSIMLGLRDGKLEFSTEDEGQVDQAPEGE